MSDPLTDHSIDPALLDPHELGALADAYSGLRARKTELNKALADVASEANRIKRLLLAAMQIHGLSAVGGSVARVGVSYKEVAGVTSWPDLQEHVRATGEFDLLHRRVAELAVKERWKAGVEIPGVEHVTVPDLTISHKL